MVIDRNHMAAGLFTQIMPTCEGIGSLQPLNREAIYNQIIDLCFEMADAFIERSKQQKD